MSEAGEGRRIASYGAWDSAIAPGDAVGAARSVADIELDNGVVWLTELRPDAAGQAQIVRLRPDGVAEDVLPAQLSARTISPEAISGLLANHSPFFTAW